MTRNEGANFAGAVDDEGGRPREVEGAGSGDAGRRRAPGPGTFVAGGALAEEGAVAGFRWRSMEAGPF